MKKVFVILGVLFGGVILGLVFVKQVMVNQDMLSDSFVSENGFASSIAGSTYFNRSDATTPDQIDKEADGLKFDTLDSENQKLEKMIQELP